MTRMLTTAAAVCLIGHAAFADSHLLTASPAAESTVTLAPREVAFKTQGTRQVIVASASASVISVEHVWARASAGAATTGAAYLTLTDNGQPDRLVGVSTPAAATAQMHETVDDNGVMKMRPVARVDLVPGKPVSFQPGGYHVMLMGLKSPLKAGDTFPLTLTFEHAPPITVTVKVDALGAGDMEHDHASMPGMKGMEGMHGMDHMQ